MASSPVRQELVGTPPPKPLVGVRPKDHMNRTGLTLVWVGWILVSIAIYIAGPSTAGPLAIVVTVWWKSWPFIVGFGVVLTLLVCAVWLLPRLRR
jgi:hypothetical protein